MLDAPLDCTCATPAQSLRNCEIRNARSFLVPAASNTTGSSDTVGDMHMLARQVAAVRQLLSCCSLASYTSMVVVHTRDQNLSQRQVCPHAVHAAQRYIQK